MIFPQRRPDPTNLAPRFAHKKAGAVCTIFGNSANSPTKITRLAHICLHVSDVHRFIEFYSQKLGLPVRFTFEI